MACVNLAVKHRCRYLPSSEEHRNHLLERGDPVDDAEGLLGTEACSKSQTRLQKNASTCSKGQGVQDIQAFQKPEYILLKSFGLRPKSEAQYKTAAPTAPLVAGVHQKQIGTAYKRSKRCSWGLCGAPPLKTLITGF